MTYELSSNGAHRWRNSQGQLHRDNNLPAVIDPDGTLSWYINGIRRSVGGPSSIAKDGTQAWRNREGQLHRTDGPALIWPNGSQIWIVNGKQHRTDGPAAIYTDGTQFWYVNDIDITYQVVEWMNTQEVTWPWDSSTQLLFTLAWIL